MSLLVDEFGRSLAKGPGVKLGLDRMLTAQDKRFQGVVNMLLYHDAIEAKGICAFCVGRIEGVLKFPNNYWRGQRDEQDRIADIKQQIIDRIQRDHQCGSRLHADKIDRDEFLARFL